MAQDSTTPELSSEKRNTYSPATVPPSVIDTLRQKAYDKAYQTACWHSDRYMREYMSDFERIRT
ncbi:uncharacterized protein Bfra_011563 [Botrytis fragariae]|uniref:Uncharacterized protein n=1 Tax=Botrytis fragariae TaxID=1964551 RepID=A0A8H6AXW1_9HELO|nr:uncharacterized protein Bfra_011563 [Botrytis fragariae]KAF5875801.1 hypothetical protein Bfra_011563 [Botrytis fragariae]